MRRLHVPRGPGVALAERHDAEFCAIELADGSFGLSYVLLGGTLADLLARTAADGDWLAGADALALARRFVDGSGVERAVALACINALTDSAWRQVGWTPPPAGNSLGDIELGPEDHLGMIGFFPPLVRRVSEAGSRLTVLELDAEMVARQQARFPAVHVTLDRGALAGCNRVVGTSTMLLNDTLDDMLAAAPQARDFAVIGPSAGLWPDTLFDRGVSLQGGTRVVDAQAFRQALAAGGSWSAAAGKFAIRRDRWPGWQALLA